MIRWPGAGAIIPRAGAGGGILALALCGAAFLAGAALTGAAEMITQGMENRAALSGQATLMLPEGPEREMRLAQARGILERVPGFVSAREMSRAESVALLAPWLGRAIDAGMAPAPAILEVRFSGPVDAPSIETALAQTGTGAHFATHGLDASTLHARSRDAARQAAAPLILAFGIAFLAGSAALRQMLHVHEAAITQLIQLGADASRTALLFLGAVGGNAASGAIAGALAVVAHEMIRKGDVSAPVFLIAMGGALLTGLAAALAFVAGLSRAMRHWHRRMRLASRPFAAFWQAAEKPLE